jgi:hypothetical protein
MEMISLVHKEDGGIDYEKSLKLLFEGQNEVRNWIKMFEERVRKHAQSQEEGARHLDID